MIGEPPLLVSGLASNYFRIRALLSTPDFGLRAIQITVVLYRWFETKLCGVSRGRGRGRMFVTGLMADKVVRT